METTTAPHSEQDMRLPKNQDVIADEATSLLGWKAGPLPNIELELAAVELFADTHPRGLWPELDMKAERDQARRQILRAFIRFQKSSRWTLGNMHDRLEDGFTRIVCGDVDPSPTQRRTLRTFAADCLQGLFARFSGDRNPIVLPDSETHTWMIPSGQGIDDRWRQSYVAQKFAEVLTALACPDVPFTSLDVEDRTWLHAQTEQLVEDTIVRFHAHPGDPEYRPELEPEYDFDGNTEAQ